MSILSLEKEVWYYNGEFMTSSIFQRLLMIVVLAGTVFSSRAQEYKFEIGGMAGGAFYMGERH